MWEKYFIFNFLNMSLSENKYKNTNDFNEKNLMKKFNEKKKIYKDFFIEYLKTFKKHPLSFGEKQQQILFIKNFIKKYNISNIKFMENIIHHISYLKFNEIEVIYNYKGSLDEIYYNIKKYNEIITEIICDELTLEEILTLEKKYNENNIKIINKIKIGKFQSSDLYDKKINNIKKTIKIKDIETNKNYKKNQIPSLKEDPLLNYFINEFINSFGFKKKDNKSIKKHIWHLTHLLFYIYDEYFDYLNNPYPCKNLNLNIELEIIKKISDFIDENLLEIDLEHIYLILKSINPNNIFIEKNFLFKTIEKKHNEYYIYEIINENYYKVNKIIDLNKFKKLQVLFKIIFDTNIVINKKNLVHRENLHYFCEKYIKLLDSTLAPHEIHFF
jgi:hypothetical protein